MTTPLPLSVDKVYRPRPGKAVAFPHSFKRKFPPVTPFPGKRLKKQLPNKSEAAFIL